MLTRYFKLGSPFKAAKLNPRKKKKEKTVFSAEVLQSLSPFNSAKEVTNILAMGIYELLELSQNSKLFDIGMNDDWDYYLLSGSAKLIAGDGRETIIESKSTKALQPLAYLRPRKFQIRANGKANIFLKLPHGFVSSIIDQNQKTTEYHSKEIVYFGQISKESLLDKIQQEIRLGNLLLPSPPEVAEKVRAACENEDSSTEDIAYIISHDTSIAAKLLAASNSAHYAGLKEITTLEEAVNRLGRGTVKNLVIYYSTRELFSTKIPLLKKLFLSTWDRSFERAMLAKILAQHIGEPFNPEIAFLCGLLFRLGDLVILQYASEFIEDLSELDKIQKISDLQSSNISEQVLNHWCIPELVKVSLKYGGNWAYNSHVEEPNYADLMVVTNLYLRMYHNQFNVIPEFSKIPALKKTLNNNFTPQESIINECKKALSEFGNF